MALQKQVSDQFHQILRSRSVKTAVFYVEIDELWNDDYKVSSERLYI